MSVPSAAPAISMRGAPRRPKMNTQLKNTLMKKARMEEISGICTCPTLRSTMVQVSESPMHR